MQKKTKYKINRRSNRLITLIFAGVYFLAIYFITYSYFTEVNNAKSAVLNRLKSIANTASYMIDGDLHEQLSSSLTSKDDVTANTDNTTYNRLHETLENIKRVNNLQSPVYTMVYKEEKNQFEFIGTSSKYPYYRHSYQKFPETVLENIETGGTLNVYDSENGKWISAYSPIRNSKNHVVALLQVDEDFKSFISAARISLLKNIVLSLVIILPFTFLLFAHVKTSLNKEELHHQMLEDKNEEIQTQNEFIKENNNKLAAAKLLIEQKNLELNSKVEVRTRELQEANENLRTFLYRSSHDIQGPLTTLMGLNQLATKEIKDNSALGYIYMINDTTNKLYNTIKSINNVYEIKNKKIVTELVEIDALVKNLSLRFGNELEEKGIELINDLQPSLKAKVDREIIMIALSELFKNGIQFNSLLNSEAPYIKITGHRTNKYITLSFEDNGIGINPDTKDIIFDMFQKGTENSQGAGLGLYAAKTGINLVNGYITLNETIEKGTRFDIKLPAA